MTTFLNHHKSEDTAKHDVPISMLTMTSEIKESLKSFGVTKESFSECIKTLITDAQAVLQDKLIYSRPTVDLSSLTDDYNDMFTSFVDRESNNLRPFTRLTDIGENYRQRAGSPWVSPNKVAYRKNLEIFLEYMIVLILLTGGMPDQSVRISSVRLPPSASLSAGRNPLAT